MCFVPEQGLEFVFRTYSVASAFFQGWAGGGLPSFGLNGNESLDGVWFSGSSVLNNFTLCFLKWGIFLEMVEVYHLVEC